MLAATNHDLEQSVAQGQFRKDLYFRLNVAPIHLPPLRERKEDIVPLCHYYLRSLNQHFGWEVEGFTDEALACSIGHDWPGNVRELKNLLEATFVNDPAHRITLADLPEPFRRHFTGTDCPTQEERQRLLSTLSSTNWNVSKAAQQLHWPRMTLYRKLEKYHIVKGGTHQDGTSMGRVDLREGEISATFGVTTESVREEGTYVTITAMRVGVRLEYELFISHIEENPLYSSSINGRFSRLR